jgi:hypothetical protein
MKRDMDSYTPRFDPVDREQMQLLLRLEPSQRVRVMLEARELVVGLIRARLARHFPKLSPREINLKLIEEVSRAAGPLPRL